MVIRMKYSFLVLLVITLISGCANFGHGKKSPLYDKLGGQEKIDEIIEHFITEIEFNQIMFDYFKESDIDRFREKLTEHLCFLTGGPCSYTGDSMVDVHTGMNISESDFNLGVDLFINAMNKAEIPHPIQNKIIKTMVPLRKEIIYL